MTFSGQPLTNRGDLHRIEAAQKVYTIGHSILARNHHKSHRHGTCTIPIGYHESHFITRKSKKQPVAKKIG